ncbi:MAG: insulinase family protein [Flavobacteriales bacterium]|nr:insulinase family protein [Flavobacteriales bacterium]
MGISKDTEIFTLENGIRVVHLPRRNSSICYLGLMIEAGSRDELEGETGLAHFIEHSLFKGTRKRKTYHILNRLDSVGGEVNAYTSKEDTVIHTSFLKEHAERALELVADIAFSSSFPVKELKKEKEVIIDEINSYLENPSEIIFDDFDEMIYEDHPLGRPILGDIETVRSFEREDIYKFQHRRYHPELMVLSFYGDIPSKKLLKWASKYFSGYTNSSPVHTRIQVPEYEKKELWKKQDGKQAHAIIGNRAYSVEEDKKLPFLVLNNLLGGPAMNTLLNLNIREKHGIAYNLESHFQSFSDTGLFQIYIGTDQGQLNKGIRLIMKQLQNCRDKRLGTRQLHNAKEQLKGHIALSNDGGTNVMLALAKSMILYDKIESIESILERINEINSSDILEVANEIMGEKELSTLIYV